MGPWAEGLDIVKGNHKIHNPSVQKVYLNPCVSVSLEQQESLHKKKTVPVFIAAHYEH